MSQRLPIFPLGTVLFPGLVLPLHIFEERYRELIRHLLSLPEEGGGRQFGVVAIRRGWEVAPGSGTGPRAEDPPSRPTFAQRPVVVTAAAGEPASGPATDASLTLHDVGCTAELRQVTDRPDGTFDIVTVGRRRFRIAALDTGPTPYLTAEVEWLPEPAGREDLADLLAPRVLAVFRQYLSLMRADVDEITEQLPEDATVLSHLVAATTALTVEDRQRLLVAPDTAGRLRAALGMLNREVVLLEHVRAVPVPVSELAVPLSPN